ncbi:alpha,alpha-trehalose-phosphate synthase (UDP-forming) [Pararhodobacter marinus]|uniref:alpha,alpha-trehalose-phosphate synthase (UDP-forming) n=1 Tax=Pararhodobacter marinus TaxID=2184063 RepID=UPI00351992B1
MTGRLIVVSNRIPSATGGAGGVIVALHDALSATGGLWIGAEADPVETPGESLRVLSSQPYSRLGYQLSHQEIEHFYLGYSNSVLWPLCHRRPDLVDLKPAYEESYRAVNRRVARMIAAIARPEDTIWVHDYHFFPLAAELRALRLQNRIGFFLHIPFPSLGDLSVLSQPADFAEWLGHYNLVGLQTLSDVARALEMFRADPRAEFLMDGTVKFRDRITSVRSFPIGIDVEQFQKDAAAQDEQPLGKEAPESYFIGVDRLDYSKGLPNRFRAFGRYLENRPPDQRPCLVQIAPPSRERVQAYHDITRELEEIAGHLNGTFAELDWTPLRYIHRSVPRHRLARLFRGARGCLVTSYADGMNLVAKEYVAAQDPDDPGVLILSRLAGAAEELSAALLINPYDIDDIAGAIRQAVSMPLAERQRRHAACLKAVMANDATGWARSFVSVLSQVPGTLVWPGSTGRLEDSEFLAPSD